VKSQKSGILSALASALFLGLTPVFGKQAILFGLPPLAVVAMRTVLAAALLLMVVALFRRPYLYIYPVGLVGCLLAGGINGLGSLFYYSALGRIGAGVGHLIYSLYPIFVAVWMLLDRQFPSRLTLLRMLVAVAAIWLITGIGGDPVDLTGVALMLIASALYALHLPINQRVLYDVPAPTVTLYTLIAMSAVVVPAFFLFSSWAPPQQSDVWLPMLGLTLATFFSRLTLFLGVKHLGGLQTAILGLGELLVTVTLANFWLGETFSAQQWLGAGLLILSLMTVGLETPAPVNRQTGGWLHWLSPPVPSQEIPLHIREQINQ
jgi:drug/metabolite transporter (DMT)-like permease